MTRAQAITLVSAVGLASVIDASTRAASQLRLDGNEQEYNLRIDDALTRYSQAVAADPADPASYRAVAAIYMLRIAFQRGAIADDDFLGSDIAGDRIEAPRPPAAFAEAFHVNADRALNMAEQQVHAHPDNPEAHVQLGAAIALQASYAAVIDGDILSAFKMARRAHKENRRALELDPRRDDAGLVLGLYEYLISLRSFPVRVLAMVGGLDGNKSRGIALIEGAARYAGENQTDARLVLALIYNREQRYQDALQILSMLQSRYPDNRLLWLDAGDTALRAGQYQEAKRLLDLGYGKLARPRTIHAYGEEALWHYKRGAALVGLRRPAEADNELTTALRLPAREWVRGRAHTELGKLADLEGNREGASEEYRSAVHIARTARDSIGLTAAERLLANAYQ